MIVILIVGRMERCLRGWTDVNCVLSEGSNRVGLKVGKFYSSREGESIQIVFNVNVAKKHSFYQCIRQNPSPSPLLCEYLCIFPYLISIMSVPHLQLYL